MGEGSGYQTRDAFLEAGLTIRPWNLAVAGKATFHHAGELAVAGPAPCVTAQVPLRAISAVVTGTSAQLWLPSNTFWMKFCRRFKKKKTTTAWNGPLPSEKSSCYFAVWKRGHCMCVCPCCRLLKCSSKLRLCTARVTKELQVLFTPLNTPILVLNRTTDVQGQKHAICLWITQINVNFPGGMFKTKKKKRYPSKILDRTMQMCGEKWTRHFWLLGPRCLRRWPRGAAQGQIKGPSQSSWKPLRDSWV